MTSSVLWTWAQFALCAGLIARAGFELSRSADVLARAHGLSRGWVGLALLATVTSLPELATGIAAVTLADAPNIAVGNALGACVINLGFLVVVDAMHRGEPVYRRTSPTHVLSAAFGVVMLGFVAMNLLFEAGRAAASGPQLLHLGLYSPVLFAFYLLALRAMFAHERAGLRDGPRDGLREQGDTDLTLQQARRRLVLAALVVVAAGSWLPFLAGELAQQMGWSRSFVGTLFVALVTTLPEMAVTLSALRLGALDMAVGNLLGSNLFNAMIIAIDDLFYMRGPLLADVSVVHASTALSAVVMSGLATIGLVMRPGGRVLRTMSWVSVGLLCLYLLNASVVFLRGG